LVTRGLTLPKPFRRNPPPQCHNYRLPVTQAELGDALGISEVHANRMLRRLQDEKLIVSERQTMRIPDPKALKAAAAFYPRYLHLDGAAGGTGYLRRVVCHRPRHMPQERVGRMVPKIRRARSG
jgi:DNA-binding Lrp family transcriptional regulator